MNKKYIIAIIISLGISIIISFAFFNICITNFQKECNFNKKQIIILNNKIDSVENIINTSFKNKKDTIIVNTFPQQIKIYTNKIN